MQFSLNEKQVQRFERWRDEIITPEVAEAIVEESCCVGSPFTFTFRDTGIGYSVYVSCNGSLIGKHTLRLTLDDDGEFFD